MKPLTEREINDFEPCSDSDCDDDICAFSRELSAARGKLAAVEAWAKEYGNWTPEEHDVFLATLEEQR